MTSSRYSALLNDVYTMVGPAHITAAQELFLVSVLENGQLDVGRQFAKLVDRERFQEIALMEARRQFNMSGDDRAQDNPHLQSARSILSLCDHSADIVKEQMLHQL